MEQVPYYLSFISITNDRYTLSNKGATKYTFEFLKTPTVSIIEEENNVKKLSIANDDINASIYSVFISQNDVGIGEDIITKTANLSEILDIYEMTKDEETLEQRLVAGDVRILVQSFANSGDYFDSIWPN